MTNVTESWSAIEGVLSEETRDVFRALGKPVGDAKLRRLEGKVPAPLPKDFVESLKIHNGLRNSYLGQIRLFNYWALLPVDAILTEWKTMTELQAECEFGGCQFEVVPRIKNDAHWRPGWVPIMDADGDKIVLDLDPGPGGTVGQVFEWSNSGSFAMRLLADSYGEWLSGIAGRLSRREFRRDDDGGLWMEAE
jgi:cell wall assembly regulator SMI1